MVLGIVVPITAGAAGQDRSGVAAGSFDSVETLPNTFSPHSGPLGTKVTLHVSDLPIAAALRVGVGSRYGFEEVGWVMSDDHGEFTFELEIPASAQLDVANFLIVFDPYFKPIGLTDPFHVTDADGRLHREGRLAGMDSTCPTLRGVDGMRYALTGELGNPADGSDVSVVGTIAAAPRCNGLTTIQVSDITRPHRQ